MDRWPEGPWEQEADPVGQRIIMASTSPRRRELLDKFGINYEILPAQGEESAPPELTPGERVKALAAQKAEEVAQRER